MRKVIFPVLAAVTLLSSAPADAGDKETCSDNNAAAEVRIVACSRAISSRRLKGEELASVYFERAGQYYLQQDWDRAIADYTQTIRISPTNKYAYENRAYSHVQKQDYDKAIADYDGALKIDPVSVSVILGRGTIYNFKKEFDRAIADMSEVIRLDPNSATAYSYRGEAYSRKNNFERALADHTQALKLEPAVAIHYTARGITYLLKKDYDRSLADFNEALRLDPKFVDGFLNRGTVYEKKKDYDRAIADFNAVLAAKPTDSNAFNNRGICYFNKGDYDRAMRDFDQAVKLDPKQATYLSNRAEIFNRRKDFDRALADLGEALRLEPNYSVAISNRGISYLGKGDLDRALADLNEAIRLTPDRADVLSQRGDYFRETGEYAKALVDYEAALRLDANYKDALQGRDRSKAGLAAAQRPAAALPPAKNNAVADLAPPARPQAPGAAVQPGASSGKRVALVMGNAEYRHVARLGNTINDARTMRDVLTKLGFEVVYGENLDKRAMGRHIGEFSSIVANAEAAVVYFAGHGSTFGDIPYVVPIDSKYEKLADIPSELIQVETLVSELRRAKGVRLVILDACRDNEREIDLRRQEAAARGEAKRGGSVTRGLARLQNPDGLIVVYSTQHMTTAADGNPGSNSPFTGALAKHLVSPGVDIKDVLFRAGQEVISKTGGAQRPEISISLYDPFVLAQ